MMATSRMNKTELVDRTDRLLHVAHASTGGRPSRSAVRHEFESASSTADDVGDVDEVQIGVKEHPLKPTATET